MAIQSKEQELYEWENRLKNFTNEIETKQKQLINKEEQMKDLLQSFDAPTTNTDTITFVYNNSNDNNNNNSTSIDDDTYFQN